MLVMDGAGWHKSGELQVPDNIEMVIMLPYSPELNPVETFWQYIKQNTIRNKVYEKIKDLENIVTEFVKNITPEKIRTVCNMGVYKVN